MTTERNDHLSAEGIQAFLEGELPDVEAGAVQEHVGSCARCRAEVEAFQLLFAELGALPEMAPSEHFAERVMGNLPPHLVNAPVPEPASSREQAHAPGRSAKEGLGGWLRALIPQGSATPAHPSSERLQDYAEGMLPGRRGGKVAAHVAACAACETEVSGWNDLFSTIEALPELAPAEDFGERVMAEVRIPAPSSPAPAHAIRDQALELLERVRPRSRRGWALAGGVAISPGIAFAVVSYLIVSHPLLTFGYLAAFLWWQVTGALSALASGIMSPILESATMFRIYGAVESLVTSPGVAALSFATLGMLMMTALWIFYRNFILSPTVAGHDAR